MESDWLGQCMCIFDFYFLSCLYKEKIDGEYAVNIKKFLE